MELVARNNELRHLHPVARDALVALAHELEAGVSVDGRRWVFLVHEAYRSPARQYHLEFGGTGYRQASGEGPWSSPQQYGLAAAFVPWLEHEDPALMGWAFDVEPAVWDELGSVAARRGLRQSRLERWLIVHPIWDKARAVFFPPKRRAL